jgi:hypothetical protein
MSRLFSFRPRRSTNPTGASWLVIFSPQDELPESDIWDTLTEDIGSRLRPDAIIFVVRNDVRKSAAARLHDLAANRANWRVSIEKTTIGLATFTQNGSFGEFVRIDGPDMQFNADDFGRLQFEGTRSIFLRRDCFIRPSPATHFVHPSGKHSQGFMRVANLIVAGPEVSFIAVGLLRFMPDDLAFIWVDTSSISSIAYAAIQLKSRFQPDLRPPSVNSFSSWDGLRSSFVFPQSQDSLALISASTTGRMARELIEHGDFDKDRIVTLFSMAPMSSDARVLCELYEDRPKDASGMPLPEYRAGDCLLCASGSKAVQFVGDLFLADDIKFESVLPKAADAPGQLMKFMAEYYGNGALRMGISSSQEAVNEFRIDVQKLMETELFSQKVSDAARRYIPASLSAVVALDDQGSTALAKRISDNHCPVKAGEPISALQLHDDSALKIDGAVAIVAGAVRSGGSLQSVSRDLRDSADNHPRIYLIGFAKHSHLERHRHLKGDLQYGSPFAHTVHVVEELVLPPVSETSAWESEIALIAGIVDPFAGKQIESAVRDALNLRIGEINLLAGGAVDGFFWHDPLGNALRLRKTFAFWNSEYDANMASQGDVLFTITSVLENMRSGEMPKLQRSAFHQSLLSPSTFGRYNDGIIQAAFLRSARSHELDYSGEPTASAEFSRILRKILSDWSNPRGEAAAEFLMAIATQRLRLVPSDLAGALCLRDDAPAILKFLAQKCRILAEIR